MRVALYVGCLLAWVVLAGCVSAPEASDWLALGFRTPEQTFRSFQTGLAAEVADLEYRCLAGSLKSREGLSQLGYREFRRELFASQPWLKLAAEAKIESVRQLSDARARLVARVDTFWSTRRFELELVREDFYELWVGDSRRADDEVNWRSRVREEEAAFAVTVPRPSELGREELGELRIGREWKIDSLPRLLENQP